MKLWLVRHAQPLIAAGVCYGSTDVAADAQATQQAALELAQILPPNLSMICSPLRRCQHLADCLQALRPDLLCATDARLAEMDFGCWEGQRWDAVPQADYARWLADFSRHRFGGRESVAELMQRVAGAWRDTQRMGVDAAWITHAGVIRAATLLASGVQQLERAAQWPREAPAFGGWCELPL
ncbi:MAG: histidine phosphatase family protein [Rhodoferax sp.]|uniref:histidine phosphatase family protein n=1 Tax=Rhodoferax sp. TaxID=50421 RepID=UPI002604ED9E|nr:histidine phosphatase family protein [Rhodoferax sp.]MDD5336448.1 histidine phosphatase family protein [Rhodoferax sp.]